MRRAPCRDARGDGGVRHQEVATGRFPGAAGVCPRSPAVARPPGVKPAHPLPPLARRPVPALNSHPSTLNSPLSPLHNILHNIWSGFAEASLLDRANLALGAIGVWLMIRRSLWAFPVGLAAVSVQGVLFYGARFYADATLQAFFFVALAYGWWHWVRDRGEAPVLPVTRLSGRTRALVLALAVAGTVLWAEGLRRWTDAVMPYRDAFIAAFSVAAQVLQARKHLENWPLWAVVNLVAIASYWSAALAFTAFLYAIYLGMAFAGWRAWSQALRAQEEAVRA